jgi:hypothetical protein
MPRYASLADQYRAHRAEMELVVATGCTPVEARRELRRLAKARRDACGRRAPEPTTDDLGSEGAAHPATFDAWNSPWMMRD